MHESVFFSRLLGLIIFENKMILKIKLAQGLCVKKKTELTTWNKRKKKEKRRSAMGIAPTHILISDISISNRCPLLTVYIYMYNLYIPPVKCSKKKVPGRNVCMSENQGVLHHPKYIYIHILKYVDITSIKNHSSKISGSKNKK